MKTIILIFSLISITINAQNSKDPLLYAKLGLSVGNYHGGHLSINYIHNEKYSFELGGSFLTRKPKAAPDDYENGQILTWFFLDEPRDKVESLKFLAGRVISLNKNNKIRLNLKGGLAYSRITEAINWRPNPSEGFAPNYIFDYDKNDVVSAVINPDFEFVYSKVVGFSISPFVIINNRSTAFGIGLNAIIGKVRF